MLECRGFARVNLPMFAVIASLIISACAGCGESDGATRVAMFGKVSLNGAPVTAGSISLLPADGNDGPTANTTIQDGIYRFSSNNGPIAGAYQILVMHSGNDAPQSKAESFKTPASSQRREWKLSIEVPAGATFEHDIELK